MLENYCFDRCMYCCRCSSCQVDVVKMEAFANHFIRHLGLDVTYTMLVLNPTWTVQEVRPHLLYRSANNVFQNLATSLIVIWRSSIQLR